MKATTEGHRYIYRTQGICPPEIQFKIDDGILREVNFRGGGCPGNAQLVCRLIRDRSVEEVRPFLKDIQCQNQTSCPAELDRALEAALNGRLLPAQSFRIAADLGTKHRVALVGNLAGRINVWEALKTDLKEKKVEAVYCLGNQTDLLVGNGPLLKALRKDRNVVAIQGDEDWRYARELETGPQENLHPKEIDCLESMAQVLSFQLGIKKGLVFYGSFIQELPGYSDFEPFALEMNLVGNLTRFMEDETVFPALEAMTPQFTSGIVIFGQRKKWGHWQVGGVDFISVGSAYEDGRLSWGLLTVADAHLCFDVQSFPWTGKGDHGK
jgi:uncharacterized protein (TIGR03905 family)